MYQVLVNQTVRTSPRLFANVQNQNLFPVPGAVPHAELKKFQKKRTKMSVPSQKSIIMIVFFIDNFAKNIKSHIIRIKEEAPNHIKEDHV